MVDLQDIIWDKDGQIEELTEQLERVANELEYLADKIRKRSVD